MSLQNPWKILRFFSQELRITSGIPMLSIRHKGASALRSGLLQPLDEPAGSFRAVLQDGDGLVAWVACGTVVVIVLAPVKGVSFAW